MQVLIGADPELFVKKGRSWVSGHGLVPGTKDNPFKVDKGAVQVDGMALEFNIDPAESEVEFVDNVQKVMQKLRDMVPGHVLVAQPSVKFSKTTMSEAPEEALELGCDPDFNAYTGRENPRPTPTEGLRTGAGHIHIGWGEGIDINHPVHKEACELLAKQLDYYLGMPSTIFDKDYKRRTVYGKAGAYRPKSYGMEYRTLSNAWLNSPELMSWVYKATVKAFNDLVDGNCAYNNYGDFAKSCINLHSKRTDAIVTRKAKLLVELLDLPKLPVIGE